MNRSERVYRVAKSLQPGQTKVIKIETFDEAQRFGRALHQVMDAVTGECSYQYRALHPDGENAVRIWRNW